MTFESRISQARRVAACGALSIVLFGAPMALAAEPEARDQTVRIVAGSHYDRNPVYRFAFGEGYRALWEASIEVPVLDLQRQSGGLVPTRRFGGNQTAVLGFTGGDGRSYSFRGTDKDPAAVLHPDLQDSFVRGIVQDQMAAQHPAAPLAANYITTAAGVLAQDERLVVMPDDPALGEFRDEFAGMLGTFFEFPLPVSDAHPGFHGAVDIIDHDTMYDRLEADPAVQVDAEAFLRARLVDILLGDFDRHRKQWRWAQFPDDPLWQPIPEDRDMAFVRYDWVGPRLGHLYTPILQRYGPDYDDIYGLTLHGWEQDRWLLTGLEWPVWERTAADVQARITDAVIDGALATLPPEYVTLDGERLSAAIRGRRDRLPEAAREFYRHLAKRVDVRVTKAAESVRATRDEDGGLTIEVLAPTGEGSEPRETFRRHFLKRETKEVRLYLTGGDDRVVTTGGRGPIVLRVIAGPDAAEVDDREGGGTRVYDSAERTTVLRGKRTVVDQRPYAPPPSTAPRYLEGDRIPPRDWGFDWYPLPRISYEQDVGVFLATAAVLKTYRFRKHPWSSIHTLTAGWAFEAGEPRVEYQGAYRPLNSSLLGKLQARYSGIEILGFYGFGNDTKNSGSNSNFRVRNEEFLLAPSIELPLWTDQLRLSTGPFFRYTDTDDGDRLIDQIDPYGAGNFGTIGAQARLRFDTRRSLPNLTDAPEFRLDGDSAASAYPTEGVFLDLFTEVSPDVWDTESWWGTVRGSAAGYYSLGDNARVTFAARIGGEQVWGTFPYQGAAYLGGGGTTDNEGTIRGFRPQRFAGDQMVFGNLDVRLFLARVKVIVPGDIGVLGFVDSGRVFFRSESSDDWHTSGGAGIWFAPLVRTNVFTVSISSSDEDTLAYFKSGFHF